MTTAEFREMMRMARRRYFAWEIAEAAVRDIYIMVRGHPAAPTEPLVQRAIRDGLITQAEGVKALSLVRDLRIATTNAIRTTIELSRASVSYGIFIDAIEKRLLHTRGVTQLPEQLAKLVR